MLRSVDDLTIAYRDKKVVGVAFSLEIQPFLQLALGFPTHHYYFGILRTIQVDTIVKICK
jgi:hypothetical protein